MDSSYRRPMSRYNPSVSGKAQFKPSYSDLGERTSTRNKYRSSKFIEWEEEHHKRKEHLKISEKKRPHNDYKQHHKYPRNYSSSNAVTGHGHNDEKFKWSSRKFNELGEDDGDDDEEEEKVHRKGKGHDRNPYKERHYDDRQQHKDFKRPCQNFKTNNSINHVQEVLNHKDKEEPSSFYRRTLYGDENDIGIIGIPRGFPRAYSLLSVYTPEEDKIIDKELISRCNDIFSSHDHDIKEGIMDNILTARAIVSIVGGGPVRTPCKPGCVPFRNVVYMNVAKIALCWYNARVISERFEVDQVLSVDLDFVGTYVYYITFTAKDLTAGDDAPTKTFQALCKEACATQDTHYVLYMKVIPDGIVIENTEYEGYA